MADQVISVAHKKAHRLSKRKVAAIRLLEELGVEGGWARQADDAAPVARGHRPNLRQIQLIG